MNRPHSPVRIPPIAGVLALLCGTAAALGQSLNVDFNRASGIGAGAPSTSFGAAAAQPGFWNAVTPSSAGATVALNNLLGFPAGVQLTHEASNGSSAADYGSGDYELLMGDYALGLTQNGSVTATFSGLDAGLYSVFVYAGLPPSQATYDQFGQTLNHRATLVARRQNDPGTSAQVAGFTANGSFIAGVNHARLWAPIDSGAELRVLVLADLANSSARIGLNGLQLVKWPHNRIHVAPTASGDGSGRDWANAMGDLQRAIDLAASAPLSLGVQVWVRGGVYRPSGPDRQASFRLRDGVRMYGGFAGTEQSLAERSLWSSVSMLSGNIGSLNSETDNAYHVLRVDDCGPATIIDGFNINSGRADGLGDNARGAAIFGRNVGASFRNLLILGNRGSVSGAVHIDGPWSSSAAPVFVWCDITQNQTSGSGGGIFYSGALASGSSPPMRLVNTRLALNHASSGGGAIRLSEGELVVQNSLLHANTAMNGGAISAGASGASGEVFVINSTIADNAASAGAGGIQVQSVNLNVSNSIVWHNTSQSQPLALAQALVSGAFGVYQYSNLQAPSGPFVGTGNINAEPRFVDRDGPDDVIGDLMDDYRLRPDSPCVDAGSNSLLPIDIGDTDGDLVILELAPVDLLGSPRRVDTLARPDTGSGPAPQVDMGCYENVTEPPACPADIVAIGGLPPADGLLTGDDFVAFINAFAQALPLADVAGIGGLPPGDGLLTGDDFVAFINAFAAGCP